MQYNQNKPILCEHCRQKPADYIIFIRSLNNSDIKDVTQQVCTSCLATFIEPPKPDDPDDFPDKEQYIGMSLRAFLGSHFYLNTQNVTFYDDKGNTIGEFTHELDRTVIHISHPTADGITAVTLQEKTNA